MKISGMTMAWEALILSSFLFGMALPQSARGSKRTAPAPSTSSGLYPIHRVNNSYPLMQGHQSCGRIEFTVDANGKPRDLHVWSHYLLPSNSHQVGTHWLKSNRFDRFAMQDLSKWRFHPRMKNGEPVPTEHVIHDYELTSLATLAINTKIIVGWTTLTWLCTLPPMHGVPIVIRSGKAPTAPEPATGVRARDGKTISLGPSTVTVDAALLPQKMSSGTVWLQLCIDTHGRPSDITAWGHKSDPSYILAARHTLEQIQFPKRKVLGKLVLTCGLHVRVRFEAGPRKPGKAVGLVGPANFKVLTETSPEPKLKEQQPIKLSLSIPRGTELPPVARVELRLCIEKDGSVSHPIVVQAEPSGFFDQAAIQTVSGWHFGKLAARMCDVYEWVEFPLNEQ